METQFSTITSKGQVTIPSLIRKELSLKKGELLAFSLKGKEIKAVSAPSFFSLRGSIKSKKPFDIRKMRESAMKKAIKRHANNS